MALFKVAMMTMLSIDKLSFIALVHFYKDIDVNHQQIITSLYLTKLDSTLFFYLTQLDSTWPNSTLLYSTLRYSTLPYSTLL